MPDPRLSAAAAVLALTACAAEPRPQCFPGEVLVATPQGERPINTLGTGDAVWAVDLERGALVEATVGFRWDTFGAELVEVSAGAASATTTPTHRFWSAERSGWVRAGSLRPGEPLLTRDRDLVVSSPSAVTPLPAPDEPVDVHSLSIDGPTRNYIAGGLVVGE